MGAVGAEVYIALWISSSLYMNIMKIEKLKKNQLAHFKEKGCALPNKCYANCARIVYALGFGNYILCKIQENGKMVGHAVIESEGKYYDPTLQENSHTSRQYEFVKSYSKDELVAIMKKSGAQFEEDGGINGYPPALLDDGSIRCVDVPLTFQPFG
jgi:hypothetical protein